jgi:hypothetical protein
VDPASGDLRANERKQTMSIWTILFVLSFVAMIAMHIRGHGGHGHGGGHGQGDDHDHDHSPVGREPAEPQRPETGDRASHHSEGART